MVQNYDPVKEIGYANLPNSPLPAFKNLTEEEIKDILIKELGDRRGKEVFREIKKNRQKEKKTFFEKSNPFFSKVKKILDNASSRW